MLPYPPLSLSVYPPSRYIGEGYSQAQEALEDKMREFYCCQDNNTRTRDKKSGTPLASLTSGQLAAVRTEEDEEILRAQVTEVMADKVKVSSKVNWLKLRNE